MKNVQAIIKSRRTELGMTMKELADKIGVNVGTISRWESGEVANMTRKNMISLSKALNISPLALLDENPNLVSYKTLKATKLVKKPIVNLNSQALIESISRLNKEDYEIAFKVINGLLQLENNPSLSKPTITCCSYNPCPILTHEILGLVIFKSAETIQSKARIDELYNRIHCPPSLKIISRVLKKFNVSESDRAFAISLSDVILELKYLDCDGGELDKREAYLVSAITKKLISTHPEYTQKLKQEKLHGFFSY